MAMRRRMVPEVRWALIALALAVGAGPRPSSATEPKVHQVAIRGMQFVPAQLEVGRGDVVVWTNEDIVPHTATATGVFDSKIMERKATWRWTAKRKGSHAYVCTLHPTMKGSLTVR